jgi:hypothetical protein
MLWRAKPTPRSLARNSRDLHKWTDVGKVSRQRGARWWLAQPGHGGVVARKAPWRGVGYRVDAWLGGSGLKDAGRSGCQGRR